MFRPQRHCLSSAQRLVQPHLEIIAELAIFVDIAQAKLAHLFWDSLTQLVEQGFYLLTWPTPRCGEIQQKKLCLDIVWIAKGNIIVKNFTHRILGYDHIIFKPSSRHISLHRFHFQFHGSACLLFPHLHELRVGSDQWWIPLTDRSNR